MAVVVAPHRVPPSCSAPQATRLWIDAAETIPEAAVATGPRVGLWCHAGAVALGAVALLDQR